MSKTIRLKIRDYQTYEINGYELEVYREMWIWDEVRGKSVRLSEEEIFDGFGAVWTRDGISTIQKEELVRTLIFLETEHDFSVMLDFKD